MSLPASEYEWRRRFVICAKVGDRWVLFRWIEARVDYFRPWRELIW